VVEPQDDQEELPQAALLPAPPGFPHLYVQLIQDAAGDPPAREESQGSSPTVQE
jgi:hypothetical protein